GWVVAAAACAAAPLSSRTAVQDAAPSNPLSSGLVTLRGGDPGRAARLLAEAGEIYPPLADYALYFRARASLGAGDPRAALELASSVAAGHPDSIWVGPAALLRAELLRAGGDHLGARAAFEDARAAVAQGSARWVRATLGVAEADERLGDSATA